jgi:hypothetical protein
MIISRIFIDMISGNKDYHRDFYPYFRISEPRFHIRAYLSPRYVDSIPVTHCRLVKNSAMVLQYKPNSTYKYQTIDAISKWFYCVSTKNQHASSIPKIFVAGNDES